MAENKRVPDWRRCIIILLSINGNPVVFRHWKQMTAFYLLNASIWWSQLSISQNEIKFLKLLLFAKMKIFVKISLAYKKHVCSPLQQEQKNKFSKNKKETSLQWLYCVLF